MVNSVKIKHFEYVDKQQGKNPFKNKKGTKIHHAINIQQTTTEETITMWNVVFF